MEAFRFFGGMLRADPLRQPARGGQAGAARPPAGRAGPVRRAALALPVRVGRSRGRASEGAHEKGGVEGEVGRYRRRCLVPVPKVGSLKRAQRSARGRLLRRARAADRRPRPRRSARRSGSSGARCGSCRSRSSTRAEQASPRVDAKALVTIRQNRYSVPVALVGLRVAARIGAREIVISPRRPRRSPVTRACTAATRPPPGSTTTSSCSSASRARSRARCRSGRSASVAAGRARFDELWQQIEQRYGASEAARQMVDVLLLSASSGPSGSSSPSAARSPPAPTTAARSRCSPAAASGPRSCRCSSCPSAPRERAAAADPRRVRHPAAAAEARGERQGADRGARGARRGAHAGAAPADRPPPLPRRSPTRPPARSRRRSPTSPPCSRPRCKSGPSAESAAACSTPASPC